MEWRTKWDTLESITPRIGPHVEMNFYRHPVERYQASMKPLLEICGDGGARQTFGIGRTVEEAINNLWNQLTLLPGGYYLRTSYYRENGDGTSDKVEVYRRWETYHWVDVPRTINRNLPLFPV